MVTNLRQAKHFCCFVSSVFLVLHTSLIFLFRSYGVMPMVYFNFFSVAFYLCSFLLIKKNLLWYYPIAVYLEVTAHTMLTVYFIGMESGFQATLIGLNMLLFHAEYISETNRGRTLPWKLLCFLNLALYIAVCIFRHENPAPYALPEALSFWLRLGWEVFMLGGGIFFLKYFVRLASRSEAFLSETATHDPMTGLFNRAGYEQCLKEIDVSATSLLLLDADLFKQINDNCGHDTGDRILKKIADALKRCFHADDCLCRIGGDEFAVLLRSPEGLPEDLIRTCIRDVNSLLADTSDGLPAVSVSVGAAYGGDVEDMDELFEHADAALYERKRNGRGGCSFYGKRNTNPR